jgi:hypothetical protein
MGGAQVLVPRQVPNEFVTSHGIVCPAVAAMQAHVPLVGWHCFVTEVPSTAMASAQRNVEGHVESKLQSRPQNLSAPRVMQRSAG